LKRKPCLRGGEGGSWSKMENWLSARKDCGHERGVLPEEQPRGVRGEHRVPGNENNTGRGGDTE